MIANTWIIWIGVFFCTSLHLACHAKAVTGTSFMNLTTMKQ